LVKESKKEVNNRLLDGALWLIVHELCYVHA